MAAIKLRHYYNNDWSKDANACSQEELQEMAAEIRKHCEVKEINNESYINCCTIYENKNLGVKYFIHDKLGNISEITEARSY